MKESQKIKIVGKQHFQDSNILRITLDLSPLSWLLLQNEIKSKRFNNITTVIKTKLKLLKEYF